MFVVGLELTGDDFRRMLTQPRAVVAGTLGPLLLLPLLVAPEYISHSVHEHHAAQAI